MQAAFRFVASYVATAGNMESSDETDFLVPINVPGRSRFAYRFRLAEFFVREPTDLWLMTVWVICGGVRRKFPQTRLVARINFLEY